MLYRKLSETYCHNHLTHELKTALHTKYKTLSYHAFTRTLLIIHAPFREISRIALKSIVQKHPQKVNTKSIVHHHLDFMPNTNQHHHDSQCHSSIF